MLDTFAFALAVALVAVTWAVVLVDTGMLLEPVQRWLRAKYQLWHLVEWVAKMSKRLADDLGAPRKPSEFYNQFTERYTRDGIQYLDDRWWWKPLWGCYRCVAGQLALWAYPLRCWLSPLPYSPWQHLLTVCAAIFLASLLHRLYQWTNS